MLGAGIVLAAIGAILSFAVKDSINGVDLVVVGYILMAAGAVMVLLGLFARQRRTSSSTVVQSGGASGVTPGYGAPTLPAERTVETERSEDR